VSLPRDIPGRTKRVDERDTPAVERIRADLARLADDDASAPDVPAPVTERVVSALRAAPPSIRTPRRLGVRLGAALGASAAVVAAAVGVVNVVDSDAGSASRHPSAAPSATIPMSDAEILALLGLPPDLGPLGDLRRRASCLSGLGYPGSTPVLGGRQLVVLGQPAVLLVLADDAPSVVALAVRPNCSAADTGMLAQTQIRRP
jgi:hypothetical protein